MEGRELLLAAIVWASAIGPAAAGPATTEPAATTSPPCAGCIVWELGIAQATALLDRSAPLDGLELIVRSDGAAGAPDPLRGLAARGARVGHVVPLESAAADLPDADVLGTVVVDARRVSIGADEAAFRLKTLATALRARAAGLSIGLEAPADVLNALRERGADAYVDLVVQPLAAAAVPLAPGQARWGRLEAAVDSVARALRATRSAGFDRVLVPWPADDTVAWSLHDLRGLLPPELSPLGGVDLLCHHGEDAAACASEVFLHPATLDAIVLVQPRTTVSAVSVRPGAEAIEMVSLGSAAERRELRVQTEARARAELPATDAPFVLRIRGWSGTSEGRFSSGLAVVAEKSLSVEEIIARHQAASARQRRLVPRLVASGTTVLSFQAPGLAAPMTITADTVVYTAGDLTEVEQRDIRLNGLELVATGADGVPRLPLLEPERVGRPPLAITLGEAYRYRLVGRERVSDEDAYVVDFEPLERSAPLFRGRAWIAARGFAMLRSAAAQTGLHGPIVSSEQRDDFAPVTVGQERVWLLARSEVDQIYEGAGHRTPIHRVVTLERQEPNPPDFEARLEAAHASTSVILRDTPEGFRYLRRVGRDERTAAGSAARVVSRDRASRVRTLAVGALLDPNISIPLPFAGLSYLDFDFLGTGAQASAFFAISFLQAAWMLPSLLGTRWQMHGSGFATVAEYNDRSFRGGIERYDENLRQRPARLSLALVRPLTPRARARIGYELSYTRLRRSDLTASDFAAPPSPLVHALRVSLEGQRGPWSAAVWWSPARRQRWTAWGRPDNPEATGEHADFQRFGLSAARSVVLSPAALVRLEAEAMAGTDLDRFSRYSFDAFENRLRGYPSAGLRFDRGAVLRIATAWNVGRRVRLDAFADSARVHDPGFGAGLRSYWGIGAAVEAPLPLRALLSLEWGYGFQGRGRDGSLGTHVFRATALKVF